MERKDNVKKEVQRKVYVQPKMYADILRSAVSIMFPHNALPRSIQPKCSELMLKRTRETREKEKCM
jgi:ribosomal protein L13